MKRSTIIVIVLLALLVSMLPVSAAFAGKSTPNAKLTVVNHTGGEIAISMISSTGMHYNFNIKNSGTNQFALMVPQGFYYTYHAVTPCGLKVGLWNMSKNRFAIFSCPKEGMLIQFVSPVAK